MVTNMKNPDFEDSDFVNSVIDYENDSVANQSKKTVCETCGYGNTDFVGGHCPECNQCFE